MFDIAALEQAHARFFKAHEHALETAMEVAGTRAVQQAAQTAPRRTGRLASGNEKRIIRRANGRILVLRNRVPYAAPIDRGAKPHVIKGRPWLVFRGRDGGFVRVHQVNHPGNRPFRFLRNATGNAYTSIPQLYQRLMSSRL